LCVVVFKNLIFEKVFPTFFEGFERVSVEEREAQPEDLFLYLSLSQVQSPVLSRPGFGNRFPAFNRKGEDLILSNSECVVG
jgi:hypothetical protein